MKLTKKELAKIGIHNPHNYASGNVYIDYEAEERGRAYSPSQWSVTKAGTNLGKHWRDYESRKFPVYGRQNKPIILQQAMAFVTDRFGVIKFSKTPFGSWMSAEFVEARNKELSERLKALVQLSNN